MSLCWLILSCLLGTGWGYAGPPSNPPLRVITLIPSLGELAAQLLDPRLDLIVGVSEFTDFPPELKKKEKIGAYQKLNFEKILSLKPNVILASYDGNSKEQIQRLKELGLPVHVFQWNSLKEMETSIVEVGVLLHQSEKAKKMKEDFHQKTQPRNTSPFKSQLTTRRGVKVLFQLGDEPLYVVGGGGYLNEVMGLMGLKNIYSDLKQSYARVSYEDVLKRNPDWIFIFSLHGQKRVFEKMKKQWERFSSLQAVSKNQVKVVRIDELLRPGVRLPLGIEKLENEMR